MNNEYDPWLPREKLLNESETLQAETDSCREIDGSSVTVQVSKPDGGWGWMVCAGTFLVNFIVFGIHNSFGVIYANLLDELKLGEAETAWIGAMAMGLNFFCGPITSALCDRLGCRLVSIIGAFLAVLGLFLTSFIQEAHKMYVTYGLVWGVGSSLCFVPSIIMLGEYFERRLALVNGIGTSGSGIGGLAASPAINYMLENVGWKNSMRFLSAVAALMWVSSFLYRPVLSNQGQGQCQTPSLQEKKLFDTSIWQSKAFVLWVSIVALFQFGYLIPFVHLVRYAEYLNIPKSKGAWLIGILSIMSSIGRVFFGKLCDLNIIKRLYIYQFSIFVIGISTILVPWAKSYAALVGYSVVFGFFDGCFVGQIAVITADIVGHEKLSQAVGNMFGVLALPMSFGPPVAGWIYQAFHSYDVAFYLSGAVAVLSSLLIIVVSRLTVQQLKDENDCLIPCGTLGNSKKRTNSTLSSYSSKSGEITTPFIEQNGRVLSSYSSRSREMTTPFIQQNGRVPSTLVIELKDRSNISVWYSLTKRELESALSTSDKETVL